MARKRGTKKQIRRKGKFTLPVAIIAGFMPAAMDVKNNAPNFGWPGSIMHTGAGLIGYDTVSRKYIGWRQAAAAGAPGILAGFAVHWLAARLGINRMLGRYKIPLIRI